jgi:uncharacterized cupredoxin-like copper-binding protein
MVNLGGRIGVRSAARAAVLLGGAVLLMQLEHGHHAGPAPLPAQAHGGLHFAAGEPGDPRKPSRTIVMRMRETGKAMVFVPDRIEVKRGEQIRFVLHNEGFWNHEFLLDTVANNRKHAEEMKKHPDMVHDDPNGKTVPVATSSELLWRFNRRGTFEFACLMPGHYEAGMKGIVIVK